MRSFRSDRGWWLESRRHFAIIVLLAPDLRVGSITHRKSPTDPTQPADRPCRPFCAVLRPYQLWGTPLLHGVSGAGNNMLLRLCGTATLALCAVFGAFAANAASVSSQVGTVLVSNGGGFAPLAANGELAPGGRVMVRPGGLALITYAGDCTVRVGSGLWVIQEKSPCAKGVTLIDFTGRMNQQPPQQSDEPPVDPPADPPPGINPTVLVVGGILVAGGIGAALLLGQNDKDKPASP
jgi:hypothetical protein